MCGVYGWRDCIRACVPERFAFYADFTMLLRAFATIKTSLVALSYA
jgi:hypothetical protein